MLIVRCDWCHDSHPLEVPLQALALDPPAALVSFHTVELVDVDDGYPIVRLPDGWKAHENAVYPGHAVELCPKCVVLRESDGYVDDVMAVDADARAGVEKREQGEG